MSCYNLLKIPKITLRQCFIKIINQENPRINYQTNYLHYLNKYLNLSPLAINVKNVVFLSPLSNRANFFPMLHFALPLKSPLFTIQGEVYDYAYP